MVRLKLIEKKQETPDVISFIFAPSKPLTWKPGEYFHYVLHHEPTDDRGSDRWFTCSAAPYEKNIRITTRFTEKTGSSFKKALKGLTVGDKLEISNVEGDFLFDDPDKEYVFIAGGMGITPYRSILKQLEYDKKAINVTLLYAYRNQNIVFKEELEEIARNNPKLKIHYVISPEHIDQDKVKELVPDFREKIFYVSGPEPMVDALGDILKGMGIKEENIKQDWFPGYPVEQ